MLGALFFSYLVYAVADASTWRCDRCLSFTMCVLPLMLATAAVFAAFVALCLLHARVPRLLVWIRGASLGFFAAAFVRDAVLAAQPSLANEPSFGWFWLGAAGLALACAIATVALEDATSASDCAAYCVEAAKPAVSIAVGSYVIAASVCGLAVVSANAPLGFGAFVGICAAVGVVSATVHWILVWKRTAEAESVDGSDSDSCNDQNYDDGSTHQKDKTTLSTVAAPHGTEMKDPDKLITIGS